MLTSETKQVPAGAQSISQSAAPSLTMELLELELSLDGFTDGADGFVAHVRSAADAIHGALLFDLPASGLISDCDRIAVLRIPQDGGGTMSMVFACLETDGVTIRIERPGERTADLKNFAEAFVDVLQRI